MNTPGRRTPHIEVQSAPAPPDCPRCGQEGLLSARIPHGWELNDGRYTRGTTIIVLCPVCDADHPEAGALITFFGVHGNVTGDTLTECADLLHRWAATLQAPTLDIAALDADIEAWRRGDLA